MSNIQTIYKENIRHIIPGVISIIIVGIAVFVTVDQANVIDVSNEVVAETDKANLIKAKKKESDKKQSTKIGDIDLAKCADGKYKGRGNGFAGYIEVEVTVKDHTIADAKITDNEADDAPYMAKAKAIIPKVISEQKLDVDTISGATYSSNGILAAIEDALKQAMGEKSGYVDKDKNKKTQKNSKFKDGEYNDGTFTGSAQAYRGNIDVSVKILKGKINKVEITKTQDDEEYLKMARKVIPAIIKKQTPNVDSITGATYSSKGIINATKDALKKALKNKKKDKDKPEKEDDPKKPGPIIPDPKDDEDVPPSGIRYKDGTYQGSSSLGYNPMQSISLEVYIYKNQILAIDVLNHGEDEEYFNPVADYLIPRIIKRQGTDGIDTVTGATYSSNGLIDAVNKALKNAKE